MPTYTGTGSIIDGNAEDLGNAKHNYPTADLRVGLSVGASPPTDAMRFVSEIPGEVADADYGRVALSTVAYTKIGANARLTSDPVVFSTSVSGITAKWYWLYNHKGADNTNEIIQWGLLNNADQDVSVSPPDPITITPNAANGWLEVQVQA